MQSTHALVVIIPRLVPTFIVARLQAIPVVLNVVTKPLDLADALAHPFGRVLGRILDRLDGVVPTLLDVVLGAVPALLDVILGIVPALFDVVFGVVPALLHAVLGAVPALLDVVGDVLDVTDGLTRPARRVLREILNVLLCMIDLLLEAGLVLVPVFGYFGTIRNLKTKRVGRGGGRWMIYIYTKGKSKLTHFLALVHQQRAASQACRRADGAVHQAVAAA